MSWTGIVLPGGGYARVGAVLRLPVLALEGAGATTVVVDYPPQGGGRDARWWSAFHDSVRAQVASTVASQRSGRVTVLAKSLGSVALDGLHPDVVGAAVVDAIWLTPLFGQPEVRAGAIGLGWRSLLVAGGADSYHHSDHHDTVAGHWALRRWSSPVPTTPGRYRATPWPPSNGSVDSLKPSPASSKPPS